MAIQLRQNPTSCSSFCCFRIPLNTTSFAHKPRADWQSRLGAPMCPAIALLHPANWQLEISIAYPPSPSFYQRAIQCDPRAIRKQRPFIVDPMIERNEDWITLRSAVPSPGDPFQSAIKLSANSGTIALAFGIHPLSPLLVADSPFAFSTYSHL